MCLENESDFLTSRLTGYLKVQFDLSIRLVFPLFLADRNDLLVLPDYTQEICGKLISKLIGVSSLNQVKKDLIRSIRENKLEQGLWEASKDTISVNENE